MKKLADLRQYLVNRVPSLKRNPEQLLTFVEDGNIEFWRGPSLSHHYKFPVRVIVTNFAGAADDIVIPVLEWLQAREPGLEPMNSIRFEAEILDHKTIDLALTINISEVVQVRSESGQRIIHHVIPEPDESMDPDAAWSVVDTTPEANAGG